MTKLRKARSFSINASTPPDAMISSGGVKPASCAAGRPISGQFARTVDFGRRIARAMAPIEWPRTFNKPICSLSSSDKCE